MPHPVQLRPAGLDDTDTAEALSTMTAALSLYRALGLEKIPTYYDTPVAGIVFVHKDLPT